MGWQNNKKETRQGKSLRVEESGLDCGWLNSTCFTSSFCGAWNGLTVSLDLEELVV